MKNILNKKLISWSKASEGAIESLTIWPNDSSCLMFVNKGKSWQLIMIDEKDRL